MKLDLSYGRDSCPGSDKHCINWNNKFRLIGVRSVVSVIGSYWGSSEGTRYLHLQNWGTWTLGVYLHLSRTLSLSQDDAEVGYLGWEREAVNLWTEAPTFHFVYFICPLLWDTNINGCPVHVVLISVMTIPKFVTNKIYS